VTPENAKLEFYRAGCVVGVGLNDSFPSHLLITKLARSAEASRADEHKGLVAAN